MTMTDPATAIATAGRIVGGRRQRHALVLAGLAVAGALAAVLLTDGMVALADAMRWVALLIGLVVLVGVPLAVAVTRRRRQPSFDEAARLAESAIGDPHRQVTAAAQLAIMESDLAQRAAANLAAGLPLDGMSARLPRPGRRAVWATLAALAALIVVVEIGWPQLWSTTLLRVVAPWLDVPPWSTTRLTLESVPSRARVGAESRIEVLVAGHPAKHLRLLLAPIDGGTPRSLPLLVVGEGRWSGVLPAMQGAVRVWATADGGARSRYHTIALDPTPTLTRLRAAIIQPAYAELAEEHLEVLPNGLLSLKPLAGASIVLRPEANLPLAALELATLDQSHRERLTLNGGATTWTTWREGTWRVRLIGIDGVPSDDYPVLRVFPRIDQVPEVVFLEPAKDGFVTADMRLPVRIEASDDLGLAAVRVVKAHNHCSAPAIAHPATLRRWQLTQDLPLAELGVVPGDILTFEAIARDHRPPDGQDSQPARVTLRVIDPQAYNQMLRERLEADALMRKYAPLMQRMAELERRAGELADKGATPQAKAERAKLREDIAALRTEVEALRRKDPLFASEPMLQDAMLASLKTLDHEVATGTTPSRRLGAQAEKELAEQLAVARGLADIDLFAELTARQRALADDIQRLAAKPAPDDADQAELRRLGERQAALGEALRAWQTTAAADAEALRSTQPEAAAALADLAQAVAACGAGEAMTVAAKEARADQGGEAGTHAERAARALEKLLPQAKKAGKTLQAAGEGGCSSCRGAGKGDAISACLSQLRGMAGRSLARTLFGRGSGMSGAAGMGAMVGPGGTDPAEGEGPSLYGPEAFSADSTNPAAGKGQGGKGSGDEQSDGGKTTEATRYQRAVRGSRTGETVFVSPREEDIIDGYFNALDAKEASHVP